MNKQVGEDEGMQAGKKDGWVILRNLQGHSACSACAKGLSSAFRRIQLLLRRASYSSMS
jgi:hypothetical protein